MFDKFRDMFEMRKKMEEVKKELDSILLDSEDNLVRISISVSQEVKSVTIKEDLQKIEKKKLEDSLVETINRAIKQAQMSAAEKMSRIS
ncbi:MAG: YbaB/EbfC family nucleoid-associated protein [Elusimicrobia bacterium]|nr:YbaB/EbfC family nucleoid-associated protein [Elusimicrobiota bacterium]